MSAITGEVVAKLNDKTYRLYLGIRGIGILQQEYGADLAPIMQVGGEPTAEEDGEAGPSSIPDMSALLRVVELSLIRFHKDADEYLADDLLGADISIAAKLIHAAVPASEDPGEAPAPMSGSAPAGKRKARR